MRRTWSTPLAVRFEDKIDRRAGPNACHPWTASINGAGYGQISTGGRAGRPDGAHRVAWMLANGPIPDGMLVLHRCDNKLCVNADHLFIGTQKENLDDMDSKGRRVVARNHGEASGVARVSNGDVLEIRRAYDAGEATQVQLAERYRVGQSTISSIVLRRTWKHI